MTLKPSWPAERPCQQNKQKRLRGWLSWQNADSTVRAGVQIPRSYKNGAERGCVLPALRRRKQVLTCVGEHPMRDPVPKHKVGTPEEDAQVIVWPTHAHA